MGFSPPRVIWTLLSSRPRPLQVGASRQSLSELALTFLALAGLKSLTLNGSLSPFSPSSPPVPFRLTSLCVGRCPISSDFMQSICASSHSTLITLIVTLGVTVASDTAVLDLLHTAAPHLRRLTIWWDGRLGDETSAIQHKMIAEALGRCQNLDTLRLLAHPVEDHYLATILSPLSVHVHHLATIVQSNTCGLAEYERLFNVPALGELKEWSLSDLKSVTRDLPDRLLRRWAAFDRFCRKRGISVMIPWLHADVRLVPMPFLRLLTFLERRRTARPSHWLGGSPSSRPRSVRKTTRWMQQTRTRMLEYLLKLPLTISSTLSLLEIRPASRVSERGSHLGDAIASYQYISQQVRRCKRARTRSLSVSRAMSIGPRDLIELETRRRRSAPSSRSSLAARLAISRECWNHSRPH